MSELRRLMREFLWEEDAVGVVEIILILVVLIALVRPVDQSCEEYSVKDHKAK